jgi:hypothetical protein
LFVLGESSLRFDARSTRDRSVSKRSRFFGPDAAHGLAQIVEREMAVGAEFMILPLALQEGIGVLGMKSMGAGLILQSGAASALECLRWYRGGGTARPRAAGRRSC